MSELRKPYPTDIQGQMNVSVRSREDRFKALYTHMLNITPPIAGRARVESQSGYTDVALGLNAAELKNGVEKHMPDHYADRDFGKDHKGVIFIAYFPISDFHKVLDQAERQILRTKINYGKEWFLSIFRKRIRTALRKPEYTIILHPSYSISTHTSWQDPAEEAKEEKDHAKAYAEFMKEKIQRAYNTGMTHMIMQDAFDTAGEDEEMTRVQTVIIGNQKETEELMQRMGTDIDTMNRFFRELFDPERELVKFEAVTSEESEAYRNGHYYPFQRATEVRLFDYRLKK